MNQTWLPSQTGPTVLMAMRRSTSVSATKGSSAPTPMSKPSVMAKPMKQHAQQQPPDDTRRIS
jgi:hypothetical protein